MAHKLHEIRPREQVGAVTGETYEFQYHQAAADALGVLDDKSVACVYCEWHDDYVIESSGVVSYHFHQVKHRSLRLGPWKISEFFGHRRAANRAKKTTETASAAVDDASDSSIFSRLFDHQIKFGDRCSAFVFVTDAGIHPDFQTLLDGTQQCPDIASLDKPLAKILGGIANGTKKFIPSMTLELLFEFLRRFTVKMALGSLQDLRGCRTLMAGRIRDLSEVDLRVSEAEKIGAELVSLVRTRSHLVLNPLPSDTEELKAKKALVLDDVLKALSLSPAGYRALKLGGRDAVVSLSRLHRMCKESRVSEELIPELCALKSAWDAWYVQERHLINQLDFLTLKKEAGDALRLHSSGTLTFRELRDQARLLVSKHGHTLTSTSPISDQLVFGLMLSIAVEAEQ